MQLTILDGERTTTVESADGTSVAPSDLFTATGWQLKPEGLCQGDVCVPVRDRGELLDGDCVRIEGFATALRRPLVADAASGVVALGQSLIQAGEQLHDRRAPDFTLQDINGVEHTMSKIGRKKKVLVVWSSW